MTLLATVSSPRRYRLPPALKGQFMILQRGDRECCVELPEIAEIVPAEQLSQPPVWTGVPVSQMTLRDQTVPVLDLAPVVRADPAAIGDPSFFVMLRTEPPLCLAADAVTALRFAASQKRSHLSHEFVREHVRVDRGWLPLIDTVAAARWIQHNDHLAPDASEHSASAGNTDNYFDFQQHADRIVSRLQLHPASLKKNLYDVCVVGGLGHVGLPLGLSFAQAGRNVVLYDLNEKSIETVSQGRMPFKETGAEEVLRQVLGKTLALSADKTVISQSYYVVIVIGTPVDEHLNPQFAGFKRFMDSIIDGIRDDQHIILRSTVYPGTTEKVKRYLLDHGKHTRLSFCPERIVQGQAMEELRAMPQIVASFDEPSLQEVKDLFALLTDDVVALSPTEAEIGKLICNVWRYIQFATANQFYEIALQHGLDYYKIYQALTAKYPRLKGLATPGFSAGPCLFKDTMQLAAFSNNSFFLGHAAMLINEGLPNFIIQRLKDQYPLEDMTVGILGMAFKPDNDDKRESLSYKLKKMLEIEARRVLCSDVYIHEPGFCCPEELIEQCDVIIVGTPHREYADLVIDEDRILVDVWNFFRQGGLF